MSELTDRADLILRVLDVMRKDFPMMSDEFLLGIASCFSDERLRTILAAAEVEAA